MGIHELTIPVVGLIRRSMTLYYSISRKVWDESSVSFLSLLHIESTVC